MKTSKRFILALQITMLLIIFSPLFYVWIKYKTLGILIFQGISKEGNYLESLIIYTACFEIVIPICIISFIGMYIMDHWENFLNWLDTYE